MAKICHIGKNNIDKLVILDKMVAWDDQEDRPKGGEIIMDKEKVRERLRMLRMKKGVSVAELVQVIGVETLNAYYKKENGMVRFSVKEALALAEFYEMSVEDIFGE